MIIPGLLRHRNVVEAKVTMLQRKNGQLKVVCYGCVFVIVALLVARMM